MLRRKPVTEQGGLRRRDTLLLALTVHFVRTKLPAQDLGFYRVGRQLECQFQAVVTIDSRSC